MISVAGEGKKERDSLHEIVVEKILSIFLFHGLFIKIVSYDVEVNGSLVVLGGTAGVSMRNLVGVETNGRRGRRFGIRRRRVSWFHFSFSLTFFFFSSFPL